MLEARAAAGIAKWPIDALRHSFCTYRFALTGDAARTESEAGHDQAVLHAHYRALATAADAERWFAIVPGSAQAAPPIPFEPAAAQAWPARWWERGAVRLRREKAIAMATV